jgi:nitroreductase
MLAIDCLLSRSSVSLLVKPSPTDAEQEIMFQSALRAPDHCRLRPWRFISLKGSALTSLAQVFVDHGRDLSERTLTEAEQTKLYKKGLRAPWVVLVVVKKTEHAKVPFLEQYASAAAAAQNICLAAHAMNYGAIWRTGSLVSSTPMRTTFELGENEDILGAIYIGTPGKTRKKIPQLNSADYVTQWSGE